MVAGKNRTQRKGGVRYQTPTGVEAQYQPGSRQRVLLNIKGITRKRDMDEAEFTSLADIQEVYLQTIEQDTRFTAKLICKMHKDWLGGLYAWAGQYRTVELAKAGFSWPPAIRVEQNMAAFEAGLLATKTPCVSGDENRILNDVAEVHAELLLIHPFREGNGRLARWLSELMLLQAGLPMPLYRFTGKGSVAEREQYLTAVKRGYLTDYEPLVAFFAEAISRARRAEEGRT